MDEIEQTFDRMLSNSSESIKEDYGLVKIVIKPRNKHVATSDI